MDGDGRHCRMTSGSSRITAVIEIEGPEDWVLEDGNRLLRMVADDLQQARLVSLRLEYGGATSPSEVVKPGTDMVNLVTPGAASSEEATLWRLVLSAGAKVGVSTRAGDSSLDA